MFTANLAGSASSHLRPFDTKRDSNCHTNSRLNLHEIGQAGIDEETKSRLYGNGNNVETVNNLQTNYDRLEVDPERTQSILNERRRHRCLTDYKTWAYLIFVGIIVIGAIALIILAALGNLK